MNHFYTRFIFGLLILSNTFLFAQDYYLESYKPFDESIPSPEEFLGYPIGEYHTRHDLVVAYMYTLAALSDKASVSVYGKTHENRKLLMLQIASPTNLENLELLKKKHLEVVDADTDINDFNELVRVFIVTWIGCCIHRTLIQIAEFLCLSICA